MEIDALSVEDEVQNLISQVQSLICEARSLTDEYLNLTDECLSLTDECLSLADECLSLADECLSLADECLSLADEAPIFDREVSDVVDEFWSLIGRVRKLVLEVQNMGREARNVTGGLVVEGASNVLATTSTVLGKRLLGA